MPVAFDTLKAAKQLLDAAGFSEKQAGVLVSTFAKGLGENLATKANSKAEFRAVSSEMQAGFEAVRAEMQASDERTQAGFEAIRSEMREREQRLKVSMGRMVASATVIVLASVGIVTAIILTLG